MNCRTNVFPDLHYPPELVQIDVHWISDTIQPSHPLLPPSPFAFNPSQHQGLLQWSGCSHQVAKYWRFSFSINPLNEYSGLISFRIDWLAILAVQGTLKSLLQHYNSKASILWCSAFFMGFPDGSAGKESTCNVGDLSSIPGLGRSPGERNRYPLQYSGLENSMNCIVHGVTKSQIQLSLSAFFMVRFSHPYTTTGKIIVSILWTFVGKEMFLLFNTLSRFVIAFLPRSKHLLISWLQSLSTVILEPKKIKSATVSTISPSICH